MSTTENTTSSPSMNDTHDTQDTQVPDPIIIGIYGVSGSGNSHLLDQLKGKLDAKSFNFYDGSDELSLHHPDGLEGFKASDESTQDGIRTKTIQDIREKCAKAGNTGIVTGHYMFWKPSNEQLSGAGNEKIAITDADKEVYTHILYLKASPTTIVQQVKDDPQKQRTQLDADDIGMWQTAEEKQLRSICLTNNILFTTIQPNDLDQAVRLVRNAAEDNEATNATHIGSLVDNMLQTPTFKNVKAMLVLHADNTLAPFDASKLFWEAANPSSTASEKSPLKALFKSPLKYSYNAFRQATWLYEEYAAEHPGRFEDLCETSASGIEIFPEMRKLLNDAVADSNTGVVIVTCGLSHVWANVLKTLGLHESVPVIGGSRLSDGYVVSPTTKQDIVSRLKYQHKLFVTAFGDSMVDIPMLKKADRALIVVGPVKNKSTSMDDALMTAIDNEGLRAQQIFLPEPTPRLDTDRLPAAMLDGAFWKHLKERRSLKIYDATDKMASKILTSSTRDAEVYGPLLQKAHEDAGWYLATEYVAAIIGVEGYRMKSVQNKEIQGFRLFDEKKTCIVPLMRGGDPVARGVHKAFPTAMYFHAKHPTEIAAKHLKGINTIILADWVINTGESIMEFVKHIRNTLSSQIRIIIVAGVVQQEMVGADGVNGFLQEKTAGLGDVALVALRISTNKHKGVGSTDTGHRLFNTTHLD